MNGRQQDGALKLILILVLSFIFSLPNELNIGVLVIEAFSDFVEPGTKPYEIQQQLIFTLKWFARAILVIDILVIIDKVNRGKW